MINQERQTLMNQVHHFQGHFTMSHVMERGTRSDGDRVLIKLTGVDTDWRGYAKSGDDGEHLIKDQPPGTTLQVRIIALNGSLEAPNGPKAGIVVV